MITEMNIKRVDYAGSFLIHLKLLYCRIFQSIAFAEDDPIHQEYVLSATRDLDNALEIRKQLFNAFEPQNLTPPMTSFTFGQEVQNQYHINNKIPFGTKCTIVAGRPLWKTEFIQKPDDSSHFHLYGLDRESFKAKEQEYNSEGYYSIYTGSVHNYQATWIRHPGYHPVDLIPIPIKEIEERDVSDLGWNLPKYDFDAFPMEISLNRWIYVNYVQKKLNSYMGILKSDLSPDRKIYVMFGIFGEGWWNPHQNFFRPFVELEPWNILESNLMERDQFEQEVAEQITQNRIPFGIIGGGNRFGCHFKPRPPNSYIRYKWDMQQGEYDQLSSNLESQGYKFLYIDVYPRTTEDLTYHATWIKFVKKDEKFKDSEAVKECEMS